MKPTQSAQASKVIAQYLSQYAEPIISDLDTVQSQLKVSYDHVLVIPIHDEPLDCLEQVLPNHLQNILVILVVNAAADNDHSVIQRTTTFLKQYQTQDSLPLTVIPHGQDSTLLMVDCCSPGHQLPDKQGVGLARKIGGDLALTLISEGLVQHPWIHYTDADARLPEDYFEAIPRNTDSVSNLAAILYPFTHKPPHENILKYEISLRYYVTQLAQAGSPYAFHTIGSLLTINAHHYAAVRGFPKRKAAEDFYMLNKLAKVGNILRLQAPTIILSSRQSDRVPFGTGAAMNQLAQDSELLFYHPEIFDRLKHCLRLFETLWQDHDVIAEKGFSQWSQVTKPVDNLSRDALLNLGLEKTLPNAYRQSRDFKHFRYFMQVWFDAFRTLKYVHYLRDHGMASVSLSTVADQIFDPEPAGYELTSLNQLQAANESLILMESRLPQEIGPQL